MTGLDSGVCVFSGGPFSTSTTGAGNSENFHYYGGYYSADPTSHLYDANYVEAVKEGSYWYIRKIIPTVYVAQVGAEGFETLQEAVDFAADNGGTVELLLALATGGLDAPVTVAAGKTVTVDLKGLSINAPNGAFVNNGTLFIQDTSTGVTPASLSTASGNLIVNNGTLDITYGTYSGNILLNAGTFTTHGGTFTGTLTAGSGADPKAVANLRGAKFTQNVASFLRDGFSQHNGWVGVFPNAIVSDTTLSGAEVAWQLDFLNATDKAIFEKGGARSEHTSDADWRRYAEINSSLQPYLAYTPEGVVKFDRAVEGGTVTFYGWTKATPLPSQPLETNLAANATYGMIIRLIQKVGTPYTYSQYVCPSEGTYIETLKMGIKSGSSDNDGTVCTTELQFWRPSNMTVGEYMSAGLAPLAQTRYMLGGKKAAIDRNGSRLVFDSLADAVAEAQDGETILVGADTDENVTFTKPGTFTIDPYGFNWTGSASKGPKLEIRSRTESTSLAVAQGVSSAKAVTYVVAPPSKGTVLIFASLQRRPREWAW